MAARKEILDYIMLERTATPPTNVERDACAMRLLEIYNERKADFLTLQNDLFELVSSCKIYERMGLKHATFDFEMAITMLLQTSTDWQIFLSETEIQRYEGVRLNFIENLAAYIRKQYAFHTKQHNSQTARNLAERKQNTNKPTKQKGKPGKKTSPEFKSFFLPGIDADRMLPILHDFMDKLVGKELAKYIVAITNKWIRTPDHKSVCEEFKAPESAYKDALDKHYGRNQYSGVRKDKKGKPFTKDELEDIRKLIRERYEQKQ